MNENNFKVKWFKSVFYHFPMDDFILIDKVTLYSVAWCNTSLLRNMITGCQKLNNNVYIFSVMKEWHRLDTPEVTEITVSQLWQNEVELF